MDKYKITFLDYNQKVISEKEYNYDAKIKVPKPTRYFYKFIGWKPLIEKKATKDMTYTATYKPVNDKNNNGISDEEEFLKIIKEIIDNKEYLKRKYYHHHGNKSVYDHSLAVAYYTYKIAKKFNLDYKSATIGAMLHDFYYNDWQLPTTNKTPLLKKHGFVHAHEALENSEKIFPDLLNKKVSNSIERHMFPLNIIPPKYPESWVVTLSDKYVSLDALKDYKILLSFFGKKYKGGK